MIDLKLEENEQERLRLWAKFEEVADEYPEIWKALDVAFTCPKDVECDMCFLLGKVAPILTSGKKADTKYDLQEAEAVSSILYGALPRTKSCDCGLKEALNEISGSHRKHISD